MSSMLWRILIAVIVVVALFALLPPILRLFGIPSAGDVLLIARIVIGVLALLYVLKGAPLNISA